MEGISVRMLTRNQLLLENLTILHFELLVVLEILLIFLLELHKNEIPRFTFLEKASMNKNLS